MLVERGRGGGGWTLCTPPINLPRRNDQSKEFTGCLGLVKSFEESSAKPI